MLAVLARSISRNNILGKAGRGFPWDAWIAAQHRLRYHPRAHDRPFPHPQFLHRRPYRSWEIDPGRPADPVHRGLEHARDEGAGARLHGDRARARHHHQGADRAPRYRAPSRPTNCWPRMLVNTMSGSTRAEYLAASPAAQAASSSSITAWISSRASAT